RCSPTGKIPMPLAIPSQPSTTTSDQEPKNRTARKYGRRAQRYVVLEAGCAAQNVSLQAVTLGLGSVHVGAFDDIAVSSLIGASEDEEEPLLLIAVGHPRSADDRLDSGARTNRRR
ncbi:MAG: nitroreductase family protein, partial [Vicinamibacteria bacterium]|nr:nitroreductase family protein [Vicinamibacteria bacterium]